MSSAHYIMSSPVYILGSLGYPHSLLGGVLWARILYMIQNTPRGRQARPHRHPRLLQHRGTGAHVQVEEGDRDTAPYGLGTYASRLTPTAGAAGAMAGWKIGDKADRNAVHLLEVGEEDLEWEPGQLSVKGFRGG